MILILLKIRSQLFCGIFLNLGLYTFSWLHLNDASLARISHKWCILICVITDDTLITWLRWHLSDLFTSKLPYLFFVISILWCCTLKLYKFIIPHTSYPPHFSPLLDSVWTLQFSNSIVKVFLLRSLKIVNKS